MWFSIFFSQQNTKTWFNEMRKKKKTKMWLFTVYICSLKNSNVGLSQSCLGKILKEDFFIYWCLGGSWELQKQWKKRKEFGGYRRNLHGKRCRTPSWIKGASCATTVSNGCSFDNTLVCTKYTRVSYDSQSHKMQSTRQRDTPRTLPWGRCRWATLFRV